MRTKVLPLALGLALLGAVAGGAVEDDVPTASRYPVKDLHQIDSFLAAPLDLLAIGTEDEARDRLGLPPRFAIPEQVAITPATGGSWERLPNGQMLWRLRVIGRAGTTSLNLGFGRFKLPPNARLLLYSSDGQYRLGPFTAAHNESHGELWTPVVTTDDLVIELTVPRRERSAVELELSSVNQGYRGFGTVSLVKSGSCNMDVACLDAGDTWREEMRAVAVISTGGSTFCTGSLLNDTANDRKMFFITANHCGITSSNAPSLVAYWNYQNSFCRAPGSAASGQAGDGQLTQFHTGSFFRATSAASDFTLVELDDPPVTAYNHFWAGWDRSTGNPGCSAASPCVALHHPSTDEKRITYVTSNMATTSYNTPSSPGDGTHLWAHWATDPPGPFSVPGVTEPGSSGSPLYNAAGRFVGQLHGGPSSCGATGDNLSDYYGRFSVSWTGGGTNSTRLSNWLDAGNTGATTIAGLDSGGGCTPPAAPTGVSASASSASQVNVSWSASAGATSYNVLRSTTSGGPYASVGTSTTTSFSNTGLSCNTTYYYVVTASNGTCSSGNSAQAQATTSACTGNVLDNGVPVTGISGAQGSQQLWTMSVPAGASNLQIQTSGGTGDADLYVRFGSAPTTSTYDCRPYTNGNNETCTFATPSAGTWHVMLHGFAAYSGLTLQGSYTTGGGGCTAVSDTEPNDSRTAPQAISGACNQISGTFLNDSTSQQNDFFRVSLPAGKTVTGLLNGLSVDYDLYIYNSTTGSAVAQSLNGGTSPDQASWTNTGTSAVNVYVRVFRYSSTRTTYQLKVSY